MSAKISAVRNFSYSKDYPGTKYVEKVEKNEGKPAFQNINDLTNGSSKITKLGRSLQIFLKTRPNPYMKTWHNPYKGFRSSHPARGVMSKRCS